MNPHDRVRLKHLADALDSAMRFVNGRNRSDLNENEMLLFALVGMRNRLVHAYFDINRDILWTTVTEAVPPLAELLKQPLSRE